MNLTEVPFINHAEVTETVHSGWTFSNGDRDASQVGPQLCESAGLGPVLILVPLGFSH